MSGMFRFDGVFDSMSERYSRWSEQSREQDVGEKCGDVEKHRVAKACSSLLLSIHHTEEEDTPPGASWVILRGRKRGDAPLHPDTHTIYEDNRRACRAPLEHSLMDVHGATRGEKEGGSEREQDKD
ncbi:unnamed protein product [Pleuronectes platessa]|uniref:Uncharacterized protein n=1 Tax=Pleuronectes platessa TaxID=8262 RepID=A0A9N7Z8F9_PLEPL|nr:unnamed protein product [Pleuronectes platessa]